MNDLVFVKSGSFSFGTSNSINAYIKMPLNVAIIGCGVVGAAIAYQLSQNPDYQVSVYEANSPDSFGATGAALGVLMAVISPKLKGKHLRLRLESIQLFDRWIEDLSDQTGLEIPYNREGIVQLMFDTNQFQRWEKTQAVRARQGFTLERWNRSETLNRFPFVESARDIETDQGLVGAVYSPCDRQLNPVAFTQALRQAASQNGADIHYNCPVESFEIDESQENKTITGVQIKEEGYSSRYRDPVRRPWGNIAHHSSTAKNPDLSSLRSSHAFEVVITLACPNSCHKWSQRSFGSLKSDGNLGRGHG